MQGDSGQLVLEGSVEEILKAGEWITGEENLVLEKKASDLSPHFLTFLRQAYGAPGVLCDFLGVGDKVEVELRDTELRFFSLTTDKLNDTEKKLQEKFKEVKFDNLASGGTMVSSYSLCDGLQVLVCQGDITKQDADALVNAANEDLDHGGGVAAALSKAGGPQVQKESRALVKQTGKIPTGDVVVTTGGNLNCKKLLHAVGPVGGKSVLSDIIHENTDVIVNTTDFSNNQQSGMIDTFSKLGIPADYMCTTGPGLLGCREIIHASFKSDAQLIQKNCKKILQQCESKGYHSAAFPAINTGLYCLPPQWEPMHEEVFKKVELQPTSPEYQAVAQGFLKTAKYTIHKIERVQNLYLWNAYAVCRQRILAKNGPADLGEKSLYHGTSVESCDCIERDRFDRSFAGAHAAAYGKGVYFAVNAAYSANGFSPADAAGLKRLYVALVLTGRYTVGNSSMKAPPPRGSDRTDCFDSVVDNKQPPSMFVIFHDDQAYPEYLITFN
uniref:Poly [ADP-ribose] polymerase n=1 Tax=Dicentrarchus labrax TaxID=13489 RepID=A0A8P4GJT4_DICLA